MALTSVFDWEQPGWLNSSEKNTHLRKKKTVFGTLDKECKKKCECDQGSRVKGIQKSLLKI